ncbi:hypothetical protein [Pediococcus damnosus]|uniref:hypothetical protein n=1 Tax=Pediococcus damnosus TaxID=51663 RepID=UPI0007A07E64|nr:hypothetical protein [Pediococcus damnosus]PJE49468.1 hypothetical protein BSQ36_05760 [Pediococcus damnosus]
MTEEKIMKYGFWFAIVCLIASPWITVVAGNWGIGIMTTGILAIGTYYEFLPKFRGSFLRVLGGILAILGVSFLEIIYTFIVLAICHS